MMAVQGLYTIADNGVTPERTHQELALAYLQGGAGIIQLRVKGQDEDAVYAIARQIMRLKSRYHFTFIVNDFLEVAKELGVDGYHGGAEDPSIEAARECLGPKLIGYSAHSLPEAREAARRGADYVAFGAIYPSPSKGHLHPIQGVERLREVVSAIKIPVVAIGGIGRDNIKEVLATGVAAVAMISALTRVDNIVDETEFYRSLF